MNLKQSPFDGNSKDIEAYLLQSKISKKSQQYFLSADSNDTVLRRGPGCNITQRRCFIVSQNEIEVDALDRIRNGNECTQ